MRCDSLFQCTQRQARGQSSLQSPTRDLARKSMQDHGQANRPRFQSNVGDVGHPRLIDPSQLHAPSQVQNRLPACSSTLVVIKTAAVASPASYPHA